ncbi:hypothetical protein AAW01_02970 [Aurantiacibacter gangjinensis]|uniref:SMP-30/Gluconolactonase/LRE-like region domain-containing protein n=1 Tax=Aurantiacibacter gangjinensis TaxID=502682 RepID=A0A0G9MSD6_9SPHN|nr:hypothetical protein AAW01_02970 [Aurantiacibacter gangjinensis]
MPAELWRPVDASTGQITDVDGLEQLAEDFPNSSSVRLRLVSALAREDRWPEALAVAESLARDGYVFSPQQREFLIGLVQIGYFPAWLSPALQTDVVIGSDVLAETPNSIFLPESALYDMAYNRLFVTSVVSRALHIYDGDAGWRTLDMRETGSLSGIALDERRGLIWIASGVFDQTPDPDTAYTGLIALDRATLEVRRHMPAPNGVTLSDIAVGPDGRVYASDPIDGAIWVSGDSMMTMLVDAGTFRSPQGLAVRADGRSLIVSDYRYGLAVVALPSRVVYRMQSEQPMILDGIDGLWLYGNELIGMRNGVSPQQIVAFQLGYGIASIAGQRVIEQAHPEWTEPVGGTVLNGRLTYIANGQWPLFGEDEAMVAGVAPQRAQVRTVELVEIVPETAE